MEIILEWVRHYGYFGIFTLLLLGIVGLPIPDEWLLTFSGYLVYRGELKLIPTLAAAYLGSMSGITISYLLGSSFGLYLIRKFGHLLRITEEKVTHVSKWLARVEEWGLFFGYFIPGVRHLTAYVAGISKMPVRTFAMFAYTGALVWSITFITLGYFLGEKWKQILERVHKHLVIVAIVVIVFLTFLFVIQQRKARLRNVGQERAEKR